MKADRLAAGGLAAAILVGAPASAQDDAVVGDLRVYGPGYVEVGNRYFHLLGVRGLHEEEICPDGEAKVHCGILSVAGLAELTIGMRYHCALELFDEDPRTWGTCVPYDREARGPLAGADSLNRDWVRSGWGLPDPQHTDAYVEDGAEAADTGVGLWRWPQVSREMPEQVEGAAFVIDGDTMLVADVRVNLYGVQAPDLRQSCTRDVTIYDCGERAMVHLVRLTMGQTIRCRRQQAAGDSRPYGECVAGAGEETLSARMVRDGWALPDPQTGDAHREAMQRARADHVGLWVGRFRQPWVWRRGER